VAARTGGQYFPFRERGRLLRLLEDIVRQQGQQTRRTVVNDLRVAPAFLLAAFVLLAGHRLLGR
jgi:hypothetical protein